MLISFYHISLCPRCANTRKHLQELLGPTYPQTITEINVLTQPAKAVKDKVRLVPALKIDNDLLSGVFLSRQSIKEFLEKHHLLPPTHN